MFRQIIIGLKLFFLNQIIINFYTFKTNAVNMRLDYLSTKDIKNVLLKIILEHTFYNSHKFSLNGLNIWLLFFIIHGLCDIIKDIILLLNNLKICRNAVKVTHHTKKSPNSFLKESLTSSEPSIAAAAAIRLLLFLLLLF